MKKKRWIYAAVGVITLLGAGLIYAWSVLAAPVAAFFTEWSNGQLSMTFTICMMAFCLGGFFAGKLSEKISVKINMLLAAILLLGGFWVAAGAQTLMQLYVGYGVMAGLGAGFAYNTVMGTISRYFPDKQGLISGILLMGFGMGSFLIGKVYQAYTGEGEAFRVSFRVMGTVLFVVMLVCACVIHKAKDEEVEAFQTKKDDCGTGVSKEYTAMQMIKRKSFWLYFVWAILLSAAGLAVISQAGAVAAQVNPTADAGLISTVVGMISIFNGCGRVIFGSLFDKIGRAKTMLLIETVFVAALTMLILSVLQGGFVLLVAGFIALGLAYGGVTPTNSAFVSSFYGKKNYSVNFSIINMNLLIASFGSTIAGSLYDASGSYLSTFLFMLVAVVIGSICATAIRQP